MLGVAEWAWAVESGDGSDPWRDPTSMEREDEAAKQTKETSSSPLQSDT